MEYLFAEELTFFTHEDVVKLAKRTQTSDPKIIQEMESYGLTMVARREPKRVRGFQSNSHDRFYGPGSSKMHGGSGWEQISGFAGQEG